MSRQNGVAADTDSDTGLGQADRTQRFAVRDLRNDTAGVIAEAERAGGVYITRHGEVVAKLVPYRIEPDDRTPTQRLLDRVASLTRTDTGWAAEYGDTKATEITRQRDDAWP